MQTKYRKFISTDIYSEAVKKSILVSDSILIPIMLDEASPADPTTTSSASES